MKNEKEEQNINSIFDNPSNSNFVKDNRIYILGAFDDSISQKVIPEFVSLIEKVKTLKNPKIEIYVNSHGGDADALLGMLSMISIAKSNGIKIVTYNIGVANSCGSILCIHGDERNMFKYATNIMHLGWSSNSWTTFEQIDRVVDKGKKWFNTIVKWYVDNTKMNKKDVVKILKDDKFCLDAEQCLKYGFCDKVI